MASIGNLNVVVLWESELRAAGHAVASITADPEKESAAFSAQVIQALNACSAALAGVSMDKEAPLVLLGDSAIKHVPRHINVIQKGLQNQAQHAQKAAAKKRATAAPAKPEAPRNQIEKNKCV